MNKRNIGRCVGVELEVEGENLHFPGDKISKHWTIHNEPSLREGLEYVFARPTPEKYLTEAFNEWEEFTKNARFVKDSLRTSLHLHYSVSHFTIEQVYTLLGIYWTLENLLVKANGPFREGNLHCLRVKDADAIVRQIISDINSNSFFMSWGHNLRYSACNLSALNKFGTIEFRFIKGVTSRGEMEMWTREMFNFVYKTTSFSTLLDYYNYFLETPNRKLLGTFFSTPFVEMLISSCGGYLNTRPLMEENLVYLVELISTLSKHTWITPRQKKFVPFEEDELSPKKETSDIPFDDKTTDFIPIDWATISTPNPTVTLVQNTAGSTFWVTHDFTNEEEPE